MIDFKSKEELKNRVYPLLVSKIEELKKENINITEDELWDKLEEKFKNESNLTLIDIVDIINDYKV